MTHCNINHPFNRIAAALLVAFIICQFVLKVSPLGWLIR